MTAQKPIVRFETPLVTSDGKPVYHFLRFDKKLAVPFGFKGSIRRVVCTLNGVETFQCSLLPAGNGVEYCISLNKKIRDKLGLAVGDMVGVELARDESKYGLPMPEELQEVLDQDNEGNKLFHALTNGRQRTILYYVAKYKDVDRRIGSALIIVEHLKNNDGKIDYKKLSQELRSLTTNPRRNEELYSLE
jgi:bifunctional DNA-binding transcriptional regulator/antitoxin component of YhaV-PrlF toxin-antitoxin module